MRIAELDIDWDCLRPALKRLAALSCAAVVIYGGGSWFAGRSEIGYSAQEQRLAAAKDGYFAATQAKKTMAEFQDHFLSLRARGIIDEERRLDWIEQMQGHARKLNLPELAYSLEPRAPFPLPDFLNIPAPLSASRMKLDMKLFHEGDLFALLSGLRKDEAGLFWVQSCEMKRKEIPSGAAFESVAGQGLVEAKCELLWLTVNSAPEPEAANE